MDWTMELVSAGDVSMSSFASRTVVSYDSLFALRIERMNYFE